MRPRPIRGLGLLHSLTQVNVVDGNDQLAIRLAGKIQEDRLFANLNSQCFQFAAFLRVLVAEGFTDAFQQEVDHDHEFLNGLFLGLAAAAGAALVMYVMTQDTTKGTERGSGKSLDDNKKSASSTPTIDAATVARAKQKNDELNSDGGPSNAAPKMDEKTLHAKIEEMDRKGKALFKSKNVRFHSGGVARWVG